MLLKPHGLKGNLSGSRPGRRHSVSPTNAGVFIEEMGYLDKGFEEVFQVLKKPGTGSVAETLEKAYGEAPGFNLYEAISKMTPDDIRLFDSSKAIRQKVNRIYHKADAMDPGDKCVIFYTTTYKGIQQTQLDGPAILSFWHKSGKPMCIITVFRSINQKELDCIISSFRVVE